MRGALRDAPACKDAECPRGSRTVEVGTDRYCIVTCAGALEDRVHVDGAWGGGAYDGALVALVQHHDPSTSSCVVVNRPPPFLPPEVCALLPHGCVCQDAACTWSGRERCAASDPQCGPEAFSNECVDRVGYRATAPRRVVRRAQRDNACSYDGECVSSGCGYSCDSTRGNGGMSYTCEGHGDLDEALADAYCGCVAGICSWFKQ
jgi:hypothetical protein